MRFETKYIVTTPEQKVKQNTPLLKNTRKNGAPKTKKLYIGIKTC